LSRTQNIHSALASGGDVPDPDWEASWRVIREGSRKKHRFPNLFEWPAGRWATAAAAVVVVFVFGVLAGRSIFFPEQAPRQEFGLNYRGPTSVAAYTETLEPLLIDFVNSRGRVADEDAAELTRRVAVDMLAQTRLLKREAIRGGDEQMYLLLEDVEMVLISIANIGDHNGEVTEQLENVIKEKSLVRRLNQASAGSETI
jgi:hypothetical protein